MSEELADPFVEIPICQTDEELKQVGGLPIPLLQAGQKAVLKARLSSFVEPEKVRLFLEPKKIQVLCPGSVLFVHLNPPDNQPELYKHLKHHLSADGFHGRGGYSTALLEEELIIELRGAQSASWLDCRCHLPALGENAESLNRAYTLLSRHFEPHRRSWGGNVFHNVFYCLTGENSLQPLSNLRRLAQEQGEKFTPITTIVPARKV